MWNRFKKSLSGSDVKNNNRSSSCVITQTSREDDVDMRPTDDVTTPNKGKLKRKVSLFGSKSNACRVYSSDNGGKNATSKRASADESQMTSVCGASEAVMTRSADAQLVMDVTDDVDSKRESVMSTSSDDPKHLLAITHHRALARCGGRLDVPDTLAAAVDDDDEVFHRHPTILSTFAATASVDVVAKPSPPKMKRRAKSSTGSGPTAEPETRRSKLSKPTPTPLVAHTPTVPTALSMAKNDVIISRFVSPTSENTPSSNVFATPTAAPGSKRVPPPVPIRRSSTLNGGAEVVSPTRDVTVVHPGSNCATGSIVPRQALCSVSSMRSSPGDSGSDDTEGKESGYVTLDDLQAQLVRSSWSSDDRETEQTLASSGDVIFSGAMTDSFCSSVMSRAMTPDSLIMTSSTTLSRPPAVQGADDDDVSWPAPPSPLEHPEESAVNHVTATATTTGCTSLPPVVTLTFTVKLDGDLIKTSHNPVATEVCQPQSDIVIPDVVVCAGAVPDKASISSPKDGRHQTIVAVVDARCRYDNEEHQPSVRESRSCQTETSENSCVTCSRPTNQTSDQLVIDKQTEVKVDDVIDNSTQTACKCRTDESSYLRPLVTKVYQAKGTPEKSTSGSLTVRQDSEELTHMSWNEVLEEAQTMGIDLHPPTVSTNQRTRQRHVTNDHSPSTNSCQSSAFDFESPSYHRRHRLPPADDFDEMTSQLIEQHHASVVAVVTTEEKATKTKTSLRDIFRWPSRLFSSKKKTCASDSATVKRSKSLERPHGVIQVSNLPVLPSNKSRFRRSEPAIDSSNNGLSNACSRYSGSSCPATSGQLVARRAPPSRTISVSSTSTRGGIRVMNNSTPDYFLGSICSGNGNGGAVTHVGSLPAIHRQRVTSSSTTVRGCGGEQLMTTSFDVSDLVHEVCCVSPSMNSFTSSTCSRTVPSQRRHEQLPSSPTSPVMFSSMSMKCASLKGNKTDFVRSLSELQNYGWYWGALGFDDAESKLANKVDGSFLVRDSSDERYILSLSFRSLGGTHHTRIEHYKGSFSFCSQTPSVMSNLAPAATIVEFIEGAMAASRAGECLYYLRPRAPGLAPAPVRLVYPISRFRCMHSLQHLCKFAVLRHVRLDMIDRLPVPPRLKEYLKHGRPTIE